MKTVTLKVILPETVNDDDGDVIMSDTDDIIIGLKQDLKDAKRLIKEQQEEIDRLRTKLGMRKIRKIPKRDDYKDIVMKIFN